MKPSNFKDENSVFTKPSNMGHDECSSLPAKRYDLNIGEGKFYPAIDSVWELTDEELALINKTKKIRLTILGSGMPPVSLNVEAPEEIISDDIQENPNKKYWPESTSISCTKLLPNEQILEVTYRSGNVYQFLNFPLILWNDLIVAKSIGQFINKNVKGSFEYVEIK